MGTATPPGTTSFFRRAATLSWVCPIITLIVCVLLIFSGQTIPRKAIALIASSALCLLVVGLILAIVALFGVSGHGTKGITVPAIAGMIINGLLLSFAVASFLTSRAREMQPRSGDDGAPVRVVWIKKELETNLLIGFRLRRGCGGQAGSAVAGVAFWSGALQLGR